MAPTTAAVLKTFRFSSRFIVLGSPAKMGTGPSGSTITNKATVAFRRSRRNVSIETIVSSFSSLVWSFWWWAGRDLNPRRSPCEGDVRSAHLHAYQAGLPAQRREVGRRLYFIFRRRKNRYSHSSVEA